MAHGNSLRALRKHIDGIGDDEIVDLDIPTGIPFLYELADDLSVESGSYLGDPEAARAAAEAVSPAGRLSGSDSGRESGRQRTTKAGSEEPTFRVQVCLSPQTSLNVSTDGLQRF